MEENSKKNRIALFIDQANLWNSYKVIGKKIDFVNLISFLEKEFSGKLEIRSIYFAYPAEGTREITTGGIHSFGVFLKKELGFHVKKKELKRIEVRDPKSGELVLGKDGKPLYTEKGNLDVELVMDVMQTWNNFDTMILFSGDSDFKPLISFLIWKKKKVYVFSSDKTISTELKFGSNKYYNIANIPEILGERLKHRNEKP